MRESPRKGGVRIRVGSITLVVPGESGEPEDRPEEVTVVQRNPVIINGVRQEPKEEPPASHQEWI